MGESRTTVSHAVRYGVVHVYSRLCRFLRLKDNIILDRLSVVRSTVVHPSLPDGQPAHTMRQPINR